MINFYTTIILGDKIECSYTAKEHKHILDIQWIPSNNEKSQIMVYLDNMETAYCYLTPAGLQEPHRLIKSTEATPAHTVYRSHTGSYSQQEPHRLIQSTGATPAHTVYRSHTGSYSQQEPHRLIKSSGATPAHTVIESSTGSYSHQAPHRPTQPLRAPTAHTVSKSHTDSHQCSDQQATKKE
ncbi:hypothetical protein Btru_071765 [Bulinus truncatus]|nr:hypothetical protein Btru_071765 [Bulinus truncatus]